MVEFDSSVVSSFFSQERTTDEWSLLINSEYSDAQNEYKVIGIEQPFLILRPYPWEKVDIDLRRALASLVGGVFFLDERAAEKLGHLMRASASPLEVKISESFQHLTSIGFSKRHFSGDSQVIQIADILKKFGDQIYQTTMMPTRYTSSLGHHRKRRELGKNIFNNG